MVKVIKNINGTIFITVMILSMLMIFIAVASSNMLLQDMHTVKHLKRSMQAGYLAEAGISDALATLAQLGFSAKDDPTNFPQTALGEGAYDVTVVQTGGRVLLSSVGTVQGVSKTVSLEVRDNTPTALYYMLSSGSDFRLRALLAGWADINGNMHSNRNMLLHALWLGWIDVDTCGSACCDGTASASGTVDINESWLGNVTIHGNGGNPVEGAAGVTFPNFDYDYYRNLAIDGGGGDYQSGDKTWDNETLSPANGIVYVEGSATFRNVCHLYGGIVADDIRVIGELHQHKSGTRNVIITRTGDMRISYRLEAEEAVVYSGRDFRAFNVGSRLDVTGALIAARYLRIWDALSYVTYNHKLLYPDGLVVSSGNGTPIEVVSWNS